jgi:hypothetical protein
LKITFERILYLDDGLNIDVYLYSFSTSLEMTEEMISLKRMNHNNPGKIKIWPLEENGNTDSLQDGKQTGLGRCRYGGWWDQL